MGRPCRLAFVAEAERRALYVSIKAYDNILALQQKYDGTTMQGTAYALLGQIAAACGLTLGRTEAEIGALNERCPRLPAERRGRPVYLAGVRRRRGTAGGRLCGGGPRGAAGAAHLCRKSPVPR